MPRPLAPRVAIPLAAAALVALAMRLANALRYPPDWGFDAGFNWQYIHRLSLDWSLPPPEAGWSTSDPPLFYYLSALLFDLLRPASEGLALVSVPLFTALVGLSVVWLAGDLARRADPQRPRRAWLAAGLVAFLPAHVQMSAMVNEETLAACFTALVVYALARRALSGRGALPDAREAVALGAVCGLALLTKLSGALAAATAAASCALEGLRRREVGRSLRAAALILLVAALVGGWFYARGAVFGAYLDPQGFDVHARMRSMPPGARSLLDYLRIPLATFTHPHMLDADLLRSVWGGTYVTWWFDGHRYFLPRESVAVDRLGTLTLLLALLPTAAGALGFARGVRRAARGAAGADAPLVLLTVFTLVAYVFYTWSNPYFAVVKGTALLGLALPFSFYASELLAQWCDGASARARLVRAALAALALAVVLGSTFDLAFHKAEVSGLPWR